MENIIDFNKAKEEMQGFSITDENGDLKPMEEWNGTDWQEFIEIAMTNIGEQMGQTKWEAFASFMKTILSET